MKYEIARSHVQRLAQHDARDRLAPLVQRGEADGVGIGRELALDGLREPLLDERQRIGGKRFGQQVGHECQSVK